MAISSIGLQSSTAAMLQTQLTELEVLNQQLASGQQADNLTDYTPSDAVNLMNYQDAITQRQSYISSINTVQARLSVYDSSMSDLESVAETAQSLAEQNSNYNSSTVSEIQGQITNYLQEVQDDLNQQVNGRYIYAGARYSTAPVGDLTNLSGTVSYPFTATTSPTLPNYDTDYVSGLSASISGQNVTFSGTVSTPQNASITVNGKVYTYTVQSSDTPTSIASALATEVNQDVPGTSSTGGTITVGTGGTVTAAGGNASTSAYTLDSVAIDSGYYVTYGVSSDNPAFQQLIAGLQLMQQATQSTDSSTYETDMTNASSLLSTALNNIEALHTGVAANINLMSKEQSTQNTDISNIQDQITNIQSVDTATVSTEITALQSQLEASYTATSDILKLSLVNYI